MLEMTVDALQEKVAPLLSELGANFLSTGVACRQPHRSRQRILDHKVRQ
jgi:hypothetical protein